MRRLLLAGLLVLGGCGVEAGPLADLPSPAPVTPAPPEPPEIPRPTPAPDPEYRVQDTEWFLRSISRDQRTLEIVYTMSGVAAGCEREGGTRLSEQEQKVAVVAYKQVITDETAICTLELASVEETVSLAQPLGDRALVGCRPGRDGPGEDQICRDTGRGAGAGIM